MVRRRRSYSTPRRILADMDRAAYAERCRAVAATFGAAFPTYVRSRLAPLVTDAGALESSITTAAAALTEALDAWAVAPAHAQEASPLELFREALAGPTDAALAGGATPAQRSAADEATLPGDVLGIAPATSRDLGEAAWKAHVEWGLARAEAIAGMVPRHAPVPAGATVALVGSNLMDRTAIQSAADGAGFELLLWRNPAAVADGVASGRPAVALVDLTHPAAHDAIRTLAAAGIRTIAFGPHVDDHALAAARALGATDALPRSRFFKRLPQLFPTAV